MHILKTAENLTSYLTILRKADPNVSVGFVPTMGALHEGHASLVDQSVRENDITVCSIFVNPTQFGEAADLETYPRTIEADIETLLRHKCNILYLPEYDQVYPEDYVHEEYDLGGLDLKIEGASRPGHFQGVCNVLNRFFALIQPNRAYFGQKDYQQTVVAKRLVELLNSTTRIEVVSIAREPNGLAMSSRNVRLSEEGRQKAAFIYQTLLELKEDLKNKPLHEAVEKARKHITSQAHAKLDYLTVVDAFTLEDADETVDSQQLVALTVVEYEGVRLLDNILL